MSKTLKNHASLRGTNVVSDEARLSRLAMTHVGFTMAEILLSLTIIGVVAAITLPSLMSNINERTWNTQRKALYARMSQAIAMMPNLNGFGSLTEDENGSVTADTAAEAFLTEGLSKVLKINNICDSEHLADCGVPSVMNAINGSVVYSSFPITLYDYNQMFNSAHGLYSFSYSQTNVKAAAFETQNGESVLTYYYPACQSFDDLPTFAYDKNGTSEAKFVQSSMCVNFVYDLNGNKGPNTFGKDIGAITVLEPHNPVVVAPIPLETNAYEYVDYSNAYGACLAMNSESRLPNSHEAISLFINRNLAAFSDYWTWTSEVVSAGESGRAISLDAFLGVMDALRKTKAGMIRCIKR